MSDLVHSDGWVIMLLGFLAARGLMKDKIQPKELLDAFEEFKATTGKSPDGGLPFSTQAELDRLRSERSTSRNYPTYTVYCVVSGGDTCNLQILDVEREMFNHVRIKVRLPP